MKEKGFNENTDKQFNSDKIVGDYNITDRSRHPERYLDAPTLQMAMKWLREEHNLFIGIHPRLSFTDYYWITADIYRVKKKSSFYHMGDVDDYNCVACCDGTSFEGACESAIKYCLENLI